VDRSKATAAAVGAVGVEEEGGHRKGKKALVEVVMLTWESVLNGKTLESAVLDQVANFDMVMSKRRVITRHRHGRVAATAAITMAEVMVVVVAIDTTTTTTTIATRAM
jgi:hypothetical protein